MTQIGRSPDLDVRPFTLIWRAGHYKFRVIASNNDGIWNETGDTLSFSIAPTFYQTDFFRVFCFVGGAGILWLLYFLRLRQATAQIQKRLGAQLEERERIARELHDTLFAGLSGIAAALSGGDEDVAQGTSLHTR